MGKHGNSHFLSVSLAHFIEFHNRSPSEWTGVATRYGWGWVNPRLEVEVWDRGNLFQVIGFVWNPIMGREPVFPRLIPSVGPTILHRPIPPEYPSDSGGAAAGPVLVAEEIAHSAQGTLGGTHNLSPRGRNADRCSRSGLHR